MNIKMRGLKHADFVFLAVELMRLLSLLYVLPFQLFTCCLGLLNTLLEISCVLWRWQTNQYGELFLKQTRTGLKLIVESIDEG